MQPKTIKKIRPVFTRALLKANSLSIVLLTQLAFLSSAFAADGDPINTQIYSPTNAPASSPVSAPPAVTSPVVAPVLKSDPGIASPQPQPQPAAVPILGPIPVKVGTPQSAETITPAPRRRIFSSPTGALQSGLDNTTLKTGTDSTTLQTGTQNTTLQTGTQNTTLQTGTQNTTLQAGTGSSLLRTGVERQVEPLNILFIVDGSRSMLDNLEHGTQKIDAAKRVLQDAIATIPSDVNIGLRVFGQGYTASHGAGINLFGGGIGGVNLVSECRNTALWVPIGKSNRRAIIERVRELKPYGMTPLAYALAQAAFSDFRGCQGQKVIILITDGADTCNGNPCKVIAELLPKYGIKIKCDVVGLALAREPQAKNQLDCIAKGSGGKFADAHTAADLIDSISASITNAIQGRVIVAPNSPMNPLNSNTPQEKTAP
jgi:hypothetical protein